MTDIATSMAQEQIKELRAERDDWYMRALKAEHDNERLRAALQEIITEADSDNGLTAWDGAEIARRALEPKP